MAQPRILVTGGAGFLGSHLCDRLVESGADVLCLDNFLTGSRENIAHLLDKTNFELIRHDVVEPILLEVDQIYNLACPSSPVAYEANAVKTVKTNVMGAINMLGIAKRVKARIVQASSSGVYGVSDKAPQKENDWGSINCTSRRACHDEGKRVAETLMMDYHAQNKVDVGIARVFNTYGPRMPTGDGRVVSSFIVAALTGEPLVIHGDGLQVRGFCHVSDMVDGLMRLMDQKGFTGPVNLGHPGQVSIRDLAKKILELTGSRSELVFTQKAENDSTARFADIALAEETLRWRPRTSLEHGLAAAIDYFANVLEKQRS